jgi:hypothetical protein
VRFLRKLLGETDALDDATRRAGGELEGGAVEAPDAPTVAEEPGDLPPGDEHERRGQSLGQSERQRESPP